MAEMLYPRIGTVDDDAGRARVVLVDDRGLHFLDELAPEAPLELREVIAASVAGSTVLRDAARAAADRDPDLDADAAIWRPPLIPHKILCVGANYRDHVAEMDSALELSTPPPPFPYLFLKPPTTLAGSGVEVPFPGYGKKLDWEVELAVVIGDPTLALGANPLAAVFGYTIVNDLSLRDYIPFPHALGLDFIVSKGFDGAAPLGPFITPASQVADPSSLGISLTLNGELMQNSSTAEMIFGVSELVAHAARVMTLQAGDVIATGTPAGVGAGRQPQHWLVPGDRIEARVQGLGVLSTTITEPTRRESILINQELSA